MNKTYILGTCFICKLPCDEKEYCHVLCALEREKQNKIRKMDKATGNRPKL